MNRSNRRLLFAITYCALTLSFSSAADDSGSKRLSPVSDAIKTFIDEKEVAGVVTLVANKDGVLHLDAAGLADIADNKPMRPDTIFWIASMTKPITGTAVLMLQERGQALGRRPGREVHPRVGDAARPPTANRPRSRSSTCSRTPPAWARSRPSRPASARRWPT